MSSRTITEVQLFTTMTCGECGVPFALENDYIAARRHDHKTWYCPNGHPRAWLQRNETEEAKARAEMLERRIANVHEDLRAERASHRVTERRRAAAKGQLTKTKNRIAAGTCPCCKRNFVDLGRHMSGQHPDYAEVAAK